MRAPGGTSTVIKMVRDHRARSLVVPVPPLALPQRGLVVSAAAAMGPRSAVGARSAVLADAPVDGAGRDLGQSILDIRVKEAVASLLNLLDQTGEMSLRESEPPRFPGRFKVGPAALRERTVVGLPTLSHTSDRALEILLGSLNERITELIATRSDRNRRAGTAPPRGRIPAGLSVRERMDRKLATQRGRRLYEQRRWMIEPVGDVKENRGIRRFMRRGIVACASEWKRIAATHNLKKLYRRARPSPRPTNSNPQLGDCATASAAP